MAGLYDISASTSASAALDSGGPFSGGSTQFDFGSGSQSGAPVYQQGNPDQTPTATATSALGNATSSTPVGTTQANSPLGVATTGSNVTDWLLVIGLGAVAVAAIVMLKKHGAL